MWAGKQISTRGRPPRPGMKCWSLAGTRRAVSVSRDSHPQAPSRGCVRHGDFCPALILKAAAFRYWRDPQCVTACAAYVVNRWLLKPHFAMGPFMRGHFNDCLLIPAALPLVLWLQRLMRLRAHDGHPTANEIFLHLAVWAFIAECAGPFLAHRGTADWRDLPAYFLGAIASHVLWRRREIPCSRARSPVTPPNDAPEKMAHFLPWRSPPRKAQEPPVVPD